MKLTRIWGSTGLRFIILGILCISFLGTGSQAIQAAAAPSPICNVRTGFCFPSFGRAIAAAQDDDTITAIAGTYQEHDIIVDKRLTIKGAGAATTIVDAQGSTNTPHRGFIINKDSTLSNLTVKNGYQDGTTPIGGRAGGAGIFNGFMIKLTLDSVTVTNNQAVGPADGGGGGVFNFEGTLTVKNSTISNNTAVDIGGGIANFAGTATITDSTISGNTIIGAIGISEGGGIANNGGALTVVNSTIRDNTAPGYGGGIASPTGSITTLKGATITGNSSGGSKGGAGGGVFNDASDVTGPFPVNTMTIQDSFIANNHAVSAGGNGGGINNLANLDISNTTITGNTAVSGGGGILTLGTLTVTTSKIGDAGAGTGNSAENGGGISSYGSTTITGSTVSGNTASNVGAGVFIANASTLTMTNSTVSGNSANTPGGIRIGGGFYVTDRATLTLQFSTVAFNTAGGTGGIGGDSKSNIRGSLLANNAGGNCNSNVISQGLNLSDDATCTSITPGFANISPLANNGGTTFTHALKVGSDAIDHAGSSCPATDQVGTSRPQGTACDIGAFELRGGSPPPPPPSSGTGTVILSNPVRVFDTRQSAQSVKSAAQGACTTPGRALSAGSSFDLKVTGNCTGVPDTAIGIKGNVTVVAGGASGFVTIYPTGQSLPLASNANFTPGAVAPNSFTVGIGSGGNITIYASAPTDVIIDIVSYFLPIPGTASVQPAANSLPLYFHPLAAPVRLFDSRSGQNACIHPNTPVNGSDSLKIAAVSSCSNIPSGALAIEGNGTVIANAGGGPGFITFYPGNATLPLASNLNYVPGQVAPNNFSVGLAPDGSFNSYALTMTNLVIDVTGYYDTNKTGGLLFHSLAAPVRLLDSRTGQNACSRPNAPLPAGSSLPLTPAGNCTGIPTGAAAIVGNGTVVADAGGGPGFVTFYPGDKSLPLASNLNYVPGQVVPNAFVVGLGSDGSFKSYVSSTTNLIIDVAGYFAAT